MKPDVDVIYAVLRDWALARKPQSYRALSHDYHSRTTQWFEPHGSWDAPLGQLNGRLHAVGAPALSALVIVQAKNEPGAGFWGCAPNVPLFIKSDVKRIGAWSCILADIFSYKWPATLP